MGQRRRIGLTGDVMLGRLVDDRQDTQDVEAVWGDLLPRLRGLDGLLINLECVLSTRGRRWQRTHRPFHFRADPGWAVPALRAAGVDWANLANNHLLDFEEVALLDTIEALDDAGIAHSGAGPDRDAARTPAQVRVDGLDVALVSFTDNTPEYAADPDSPGVAYNELDPDDEEAMRVLDRALDRAKDGDPDLLVASLHWGPNMRAEPLPRHAELGRRLVERGVDVVHGHSAHVFQGVEVHDGGLILHDTGDFVDDYAVDEELRNDRGFLFELAVADGQPEELRLHPTEIDGCAVYEADPGTARWCRERMRELSEPFGTTFERDGDGLVLEL